MKVKKMNKHKDELKVEFVNAAEFDIDDGGRNALVAELGFDPGNKDELPKREKLQLETDIPVELEYESGHPITTEFGRTNMFLLKQDGVDKIYFSKSKRLLFGILKAKLVPGDKFKITKRGAGTDITYEIEKL